MLIVALGSKKTKRWALMGKGIGMGFDSRDQGHLKYPSTRKDAKRASSRTLLCSGEVQPCIHLALRGVYCRVSFNRYRTTSSILPTVV